MPSAPPSLPALLSQDGIVRLVGAHNAMGAKMAVRAGFDGVWSSGFELSASYGVPDASVVTMSEHLSAVQAMRHAVDVPIVADCDTGYGDAYNAAHMARRFEAAGVSAVCIEDKHFPKRNSFMDSDQALLPIEEFILKLTAIREVRQSEDFLIIARTEALVTGLGVDEALRRAEAYVEAGADAILLHSKARTCAPIAEALQRWRKETPVVVVPTTYPQVTATQLHKLGAKVVIYANHGMRSALAAMDATYHEILQAGSSAHLEDSLWSVRSVFELQGTEELEELRGSNNGQHRSPAPDTAAPVETTDACRPATELASGPVSELASEPALQGDELCRQFQSAGIDFFTGVPDSTLKGVFRYLEEAQVGYVAAVSEQAAIGLATGAYLGGRLPLVAMQNSGLGTAVTTLASLPGLYRVPMVLLIGWRGDDGCDAPEHLKIGQITLDLLRRLDIPFRVLSPGDALGTLATDLTAQAIAEARPVALVVRRKALE